MTTLLAPSRTLRTFFDDDTLTAPGAMLQRMWPSLLNATLGGDGHDLPAVNIRDNAKTYELELAAPGYRKEELKVNVDGDLLNISSDRKTDKEERTTFTRHEFSCNGFQRSFTLPGNADGENLKASFDSGILRLSIPKTKTLPEKHGKEIRIL